MKVIWVAAFLESHAIRDTDLQDQALYQVLEVFVALWLQSLMQTEIRVAKMPHDRELLDDSFPS